MNLQNLGTSDTFNGMISMENFKAQIEEAALNFQYQKKEDGTQSDHYRIMFSAERVTITIHKDVAAKINGGAAFSYKVEQKATTNYNGVKPENVGKAYTHITLFIPKTENVAISL